ncbi:MAG: bifunctional (p)ppGpp synthetase/guanosine-3',5'-bis(diphosphate) 3'-pyrophosphohydrolase [Bacilli bacterium]|nr:bifunctional (p)ppGpp synthetase/guanosine-3',5'-bis(diphosphate) 3'-pyrophosphohydrolase [Bacilli bacterium]
MEVEELKERLFNNLSNYTQEEKTEIEKAYELAKNLHSKQYRQSGEPYITHPIEVAIILSEMKADKDTICAGLLHDTVEDTDITLNEIEKMFNKDVAILVDGVTKISKLNFSSKQDRSLANTRKIIASLTEDVRIIIVKLADRLHNMRTLQYKTEFKQKENALETMEIFVPLAYYIGAYRIKNELEDLSLKYLKPEEYKKAEETHLMVQEDSKKCLEEMLFNIHTILNDNNIPNEIKSRTKNIYGLYKKLSEGNKLEDIHDLLSLKIMVDEINSCYLTLGLVHSKYNPINYRFKDYICNPKTNMYQSLHTTVFGEDDRLVQTQIRTFDMDEIASYGLTSYWHQNKDAAREKMQHDLKEKYQFFKSLTEINTTFGDNQEFITQIKRELFTDKIYVYTTKGDVIELPIGATPIDFAYRIHTDIGNSMIGAIVNDDKVSIYDELHNKDRVRIITSSVSMGPGKDWEENAKTTNAKKKIREFNRK